MNSDVLYATTDNGQPLPIIDVTHPAFAVTVTSAELATMSDQFLLESQQRLEMSPAIIEVMKQSVLGGALMAASGSFLTGLSTYMFKLGPDNLGADANPIDQHIARSFPAFAMRLRLQDMSRLLADGLASILTATPTRQISFLNIAGGPAADTWNTLLHLKAEHPNLLTNRKISISVLDLDEHGPSFGSRAFDTLRAPGAPLSALDITFKHLPYEWSQTHQLTEILAPLRATHAACAISSEGGLFEYGSDEQIIANLQQLHAGTPHDAFVVGSVTRDSELLRISHSNIQIPTRPRTLEAFQHLATQSGWTVHHVLERPMSYNLRLTKV